MPPSMWTCPGCGKSETGLSVPNGWLALTVRKSARGADGPKMLREGPIDAMSGVYCGYDCVSIRADRVARTRRYGVVLDTLRGNITVDDLMVDDGA